jgi:hypothetical protein
MSNGNDSASCQDSDRRTLRVDRRPAIPLGSRIDPLSSEDIDTQIRWFFDNALKRKSQHHR